jgi:ParB family transcriptional regulator, chromosome partitioning protein
MSAKKNSLGRGLGALIEEASTIQTIGSEVSAAVNEINIDKIEVNPFQPRKNFDEEALNELAASIKELGIIQPITVKKLDDDRYQIIAGERRFRASQIAGLNSLPAFVRNADDQSLLEMALVENIQREDLNSIEVAISYQRLIEECNLTQETLSDRVGKKRATISNYLRLLRLPAEIQLGIREKKLTMGHARTLITLENEEQQLEIFNRILDEELSVRKTEELVKFLNNPVEPASEDTEIENQEEDVESIESDSNLEPFLETESNEVSGRLKTHLSSFFAAKVEVKRTPKGTGKIVIPFKSDKDLERIKSLFDKINS